MHDIQQLEAQVAMLKAMVATRRAKPEELHRAEEALRLANQKAQAKTVTTRPIVEKTEAPTPEPVRASPAVTFTPDWVVETVFKRKGELMTEIKSLTAERNELSNRLHEIPSEVACPELTKKIVSLQRRIESLWTEYRFIERNGRLPDTKPKEEKAYDPEREIKLLRISTDLKRLRDIRLKLEKKLDKPHLHTKFPETKIPEWQQDLIFVNAQIDELEFQKDNT